MQGYVTQKQHLLEYLQSNAPVRARDLENAGISAATISRSVQAGEILRIGRGVYSISDHVPDFNESLIEIAVRVPRAVICLTSALLFHELTDELPRHVWVAIGAGDWKPKIACPKIHVVRFREPYFSEGIEEHRINGKTIRIYSITKTLADAFRKGGLIERSVAIGALKEAIYQRKAKVSEIAENAQKYGAWNQMNPCIETIISNG